MPKKGHTEEQIIATLRQQEAGGKTTDSCPSGGHLNGNSQIPWGCS
jgi:hypothetical protein